MAYRYLAINGPFRKFPSPGKCIYCGDSSSILTDEHIIPYSIAANMFVYKKASCTKCADIFKKDFESEVLSKTLMDFRFKVGAPTRKKKSRGRTRNIYIGKTEGERLILTDKREYSQLDFPLSFICLKLHMPNIFLGVTSTKETKVEAWSNVSLADLRAAASGLSSKEVYVGQINPIQFARFLAKIAYAYAHAVVGIKVFRPIILPTIMFDSGLFPDLVGGKYEVEQPSDNLHELSHYVADFKNTKFLCVRIRLFARFGLSTYHVVVGTVSLI